MVLEHLKWSSQKAGTEPRFSYFRTKDGIEVDLLIEHDTKIYAREIKASRTRTTFSTKALYQTEQLIHKPLRKTILAPVEFYGF